MPLTDEQLADAKRLKQRFVDWQIRKREHKEPYSQEAAAGLLGFNQSALNQYLNGKIPLNVDAAIKMAAVFGCTVAEFSPGLAEQASKYAAAAPSEHSLLGNLQRVAVGEPVETIAIKKVSLKLQAGITGFETDLGFDDGGTIHVPRNWVEKNELVPQCLLAIKVKGQSMEPALFEDDIVVINIADTKPVSNELYAINFNGEAVIKQLVKEGPDWYMYSFNRAPEFGRRHCRGGDCIIVGKVVWQAGRPLSGRL